MTTTAGPIVTGNYDDPKVSSGFVGTIIVPTKLGSPNADNSQWRRCVHGDGNAVVVILGDGDMTRTVVANTN
jgi:hypothetical protein